jgi:hypothetical protein
MLVVLQGTSWPYKKDHGFPRYPSARVLLRWLFMAFFSARFSNSSSFSSGKARGVPEDPDISPSMEVEPEETVS